MLLGLASVKGSPGVSTFAVALAARWPSPWRVVLVEADPAGGDLAARYGLPWVPGLVSLAAAARRSTDPELVSEHAQQLAGGVRVVPGPVRPDQAHAALATICAADGTAGVFGSFTGRGDIVLIVDCGRLSDDPNSPVHAVLRAADQLLILAHPHADELTRIAARVSDLASVPAHTRLVLVGSGYPVREVEQTVGLAVLGGIPNDPRTAAALTGHQGVRPRARSPLARAAARVAGELASDPRRFTATPMQMYQPSADSAASRHDTHSGSGS